MARLKQAEIARIREKNVRISKIIHQLQLEEELIQPSLYPEEQPEELLTVQVNTCSLRGYIYMYIAYYMTHSTKYMYNACV